jgi:2-polyprenyl-6-methoxyphenol hydroxylase-like FAD-dependent oxidoreductase
MRITIVGAGPVGLLTACLLAQERQSLSRVASHTQERQSLPGVDSHTQKHRITIIDKRVQHSRNHLLSISDDTIQAICQSLLNSDNEIIIELIDLLRSWSNQPVSTSVIQESLLQIAIRLGVEINLGTSVESLDDIRDSIVIGADGARSKIRQLAFNDELVDQHTISYMAQLKFTTPGRTKPRPLLTTMSHSFLNGITGDDIVMTFESMSRPNDELRKSGTLHIPIPKSVYDILSANGRGNFTTAWTPEELSRIQDSQVAKLLRVIKRYRFGVTWRDGWIENPKITVIPLNIYRSARTFTVKGDKLVLLVGDAASGLVYERGLNKGWLEVVKLSTTLSNISPETIYHNLVQYSEDCTRLYERERDLALQKGRKIQSINQSTAVGSKLASVGLGTVLSGMLIKSGLSLLR